jgi:ABC-2 type transport system permease protein
MVRKKHACEAKQMSELSGIFAIWYREIKVFLRERSRVVSSIINPIFWLVVLGGGLGSAVSFANVNYQTFIFPGILGQTVLFSSIFFGLYIVWDKKIDFLKEVLVAPISRTSIFVGKILGGATDSLIQVVILMVMGMILTQFGVLSGLVFTIPAILMAILLLFITTTGMVSIGLIIGSQLESIEGFQIFSTFLIMPMFFLSGALFPLDNLPSWLAVLTNIDPLTYAVDGLRALLLGTSHFPLAFDFVVITIFSMVLIAIGTFAFQKMKV